MIVIVDVDVALIVSLMFFVNVLLTVSLIVLRPWSR